MRTVFPIAAAAMLLFIGGSVRVRCSTPERPKVEQVSFSGNAEYNTDRLLQLMATRPPGFLSSTDFHPDVFAGDLQNIVAFYRQNGYLEAAIADTELTRDTAQTTVSIHIGIHEGGRTFVESIATKGNTIFADTTLIRIAGLKPGDPFLGNKLQSGMIAIVAMYGDSGYIDATVVPNLDIDSRRHRAGILLDVTERVRRVVDSIRITGLQKTEESVVRRELLFHEGDVVRYSQLLESQRLLYNTGLFESVFIRPVPEGDSLTPATIIRVELREKLAGEFNVTVGYGSVEKVKGGVGVVDNNLFGTGRRASLTPQADFIEQGVQGTFTEPWTFGTRWQTDLNVAFQYLIEPSYQLRRLEGVITVGRPFGKSARISTSFQYQNATLIDVLTAAAPSDSNPRIRSFSLTYHDDTRDDLFDPTRGYFVELTTEVAGAFLSGTNSFVKTEGRARGFQPYGRTTIIGSSLEIGWMEPFGSSHSIPISERFFAGGPISLRGFQYQEAGPLDTSGNPLGGQFEIVWNLLEVRQTLYKFIGGAAFVDVGNVWSRLQDFKPNDIRVGFGPGLRVNTPVGVVRVDYGINASPRAREPHSVFYFSMGEAF